MVIAIGSNGDRHWCQWRWGAPLAPLRPSPLEPMDRHWLHLLSPLAPMATTPNRYDPFTQNFEGKPKKERQKLIKGNYQQQNLTVAVSISEKPC